MTGAVAQVPLTLNSRNWPQASGVGDLRRRSPTHLRRSMPRSRMAAERDIPDMRG